MAQCPNCEGEVAPTALKCAACGADFSGDGWKPVERAGRQAPVMNTDNPFEAPRASLDVAAKERGPAPATVRYAIRLLWFSLAVAVVFAIISAVGISLPGGHVSNFGDFAANVLGIGILGFFIHFISAGRNWARWIFAILFGIGTVLYFWSLLVVIGTGIAIPLALRALSVVQNMIQMCVIVLLFLPASNEWFAAGP